MKTGIEIIAKERQEHFDKHGFTLEGDLVYDKGELASCATAILQQDVSIWPWNPDFLIKHIFRKTRQEQLAIAGSLVAAEIDRLNHYLTIP